MSPPSELDAARAFGRKEAIEEGVGSANVLMAELARWQEIALKMGFDGIDAAIAWGEDAARLRAIENLLRKYIAHVTRCESINFIDRIGEPMFSDVEFTKAH